MGKEVKKGIILGVCNIDRTTRNYRFRDVIYPFL